MTHEKLTDIEAFEQSILGRVIARAEEGEGFKRVPSPGRKSKGHCQGESAETGGRTWAGLEQEARLLGLDLSRP